ncbi:hypothetical protein C2E23DRAFT_7660 [Lenzites betulinus]|nr:hypothetical protein C2E23DRAFT_7660 [Lenzites betulinus]
MHVFKRCPVSYSQPYAAPSWCRFVRVGAPHFLPRWVHCVVSRSYVASVRGTTGREWSKSRQSPSVSCPGYINHGWRLELRDAISFASHGSSGRSEPRLGMVVFDHRPSMFMSGRRLFAIRLYSGKVFGATGRMVVMLLMHSGLSATRRRTTQLTTALFRRTDAPSLMFVHPGYHERATDLGGGTGAMWRQALMRSSRRRRLLDQQRRGDGIPCIGQHRQAILHGLDVEAAMSRSSTTPPLPPPDRGGGVVTAAVVELRESP